MFTLNYSYYTFDRLADFVEDSNTFPVVEKKGVKYANCPASFDIETSSFYDGNGMKRAVMYIWQFGLNGNVIIGRTWAQFEELLKSLTAFHNLDYDRQIVVYVHNLPYEFQWMARRFDWTDVFFKDIRKPLYCKMDGFIFKCSYALTNESLYSVGKNLTKYKVEKAAGLLDYLKIRTPITPMTDDEIKYCVNDALVVMACIQEKIETDGDILSIPYTKTGYVRNFCREKTLYQTRKSTGKRKASYDKEYRNLMKTLTLTPETYEMARRKCFQGGFTHANKAHRGEILENVDSVDFTSSYPYVMCTETFPMSAPEKVEGISYKDLDALNGKYHYMCDIAFVNLSEVDGIPDNYLSKSKCAVCSGRYDTDGNLIESPIIDNGRVMWAQYVVTSVTDVDLAIMRKYYTWDEVKVRNVYKMVKARLPKKFIQAVLSLYKDKTSLKGIKGKETEYQIAKGMINSTYGMSVTDIVNDLISYDAEKGEYTKDKADLEKELDKYNKSKSRFLYYLWGVWVTAYARYNLLMSILQFGDDYLYADTDSIKFTNYAAHKDYIEAYNEHVSRKIRGTCKEYDLSFADFAPKTIKGEEKTLGVWEWETEKDKYKRFKTIGAKRYLYEDTDGLHLTTSGVNKKTGAEYLETFFVNPFNVFAEKLTIPSDFSGRIISTYIDHETSGIVTDYRGTPYAFHEMSSVHMEPTTYVYNKVAGYNGYLKGFQEISEVR